MSQILCQSGAAIGLQYEPLPRTFVVDLFPRAHVDMFVARHLSRALAFWAIHHAIRARHRIAAQPHLAGKPLVITAGDAAHGSDRHGDERDNFGHALFFAVPFAFGSPPTSASRSSAENSANCS